MSTTFFDDDNCTIGFDFIQVQSHHNKDLSSPAEVASTLNCLHPISNVYKRGMYALHNQYIVHYDTDFGSTINTVLDVTNARMSIMEEAETCGVQGFKLSKNDFTFEFTSPNRQIAMNWIKALKQKVVLTQFHENFSPVKSLGKGGFAKVCLVEAKADKGYYAVKGFSKRGFFQSLGSKAKATLLNEIDMMRRMNHKNIVHLYEVYETENSIYLLMELIKGKTLYDMLKHGKERDHIPESQVQKMFYAIMSSLAYIASKGVMHRDLKPANILIGKDYTVKIADFGLATEIGLPSYIFKKCGTPGFMAPEVFKYKENVPATFYDHKCDVFSAGCIFYDLLFFHSFFAGSNSSEVNALNQEPEELYTRRKAIEKEYESKDSKIDKNALHLLLQLLEDDPKKRPTAAQTLEHSYFQSLHKKSPKLSAEDGLDSPMFPPAQNGWLSPLAKANLEFCNFNFKMDSTNFGSYVAAHPGKFTEKDSLYLAGVGKGNSEKSTDSMNTFSGALHNFEKMEYASHGSLSAFATTPKNNIAGKDNRSPKNATQGVTHAKESQFLKAAIMKNKQNHVEEGEGLKKFGVMGRFKTDNHLPRLDMELIKGDEEAKEEGEKPMFESSELNEQGDECYSVSMQINHLPNLVVKKIHHGTKAY